MKIDKEFLPFLVGKTIELFENHLFLFLEEVEAEKLTTREPCTEAAIRFEGPINGTLIIVAEAVVARAVAANLLGAEENSPDAERLALDAMAETVNMLCGYVIDEICEQVGAEQGEPYSGETCQHIPETRVAEAERLREAIDYPVSLAFDTDEGFFVVALSVE